MGICLVQRNYGRSVAALLSYTSTHWCMATEATPTGTTEGEKISNYAQGALTPTVEQTCATHIKGQQLQQGRLTSYFVLVALSPRRKRNEQNRKNPEI